MNRVKIWILLFAMLLWGTASAQQIIRGRILEGGSATPLAGASIVNKKDSALSTHSDTAGYFSLRLESLPAVLDIRYMGFQPEELVISEGQTSEPITIYLVSHNMELKEVDISTGYYTLSKERATGSFDHISS